MQKGRNDYNSGTQPNLSNFNNLFGLVDFDLTNQAEKVTRDPKQLIFRYKINVAPEIVVIDKIGNELVIA